MSVGFDIFIVDFSPMMPQIEIAQLRRNVFGRRCHECHRIVRCFVQVRRTGDIVDRNGNLISSGRQGNLLFVWSIYPIGRCQRHPGNTFADTNRPQNKILKPGMPTKRSCSAVPRHIIRIKNISLNNP